MRVRRYDYGSQFADILPSVMDTVCDVLNAGSYILGEHVEEFELAFASYIGAEHCIGVNSGTDALILGLVAAGLGPGSRVAVQANTFHATVLAIVRIGATPVLIDADPDTFLMDLDALEREESLDAILPVHLFGLATDLKRVLSHADRIGAIVVEDCAQSHGAFSANVRTGTAGKVGCFSFHPSKNFAAAGDGGACVTNDADLADRIRRLRHLGQEQQNEHVVLGYNSRLDALQAIILLAKLPKLDHWNEARVAVARRYVAGMRGLPVSFQEAGGRGEHVYHLFQVRTSHRDALLGHLQAAGIDATVRYPSSIPGQPVFSQASWAAGAYPIADALAGELLCLPIRPDLQDTEIEDVIASTKAFYT